MLQIDDFTVQHSTVVCLPHSTTAPFKPNVVVFAWDFLYIVFLVYTHAGTYPCNYTGLVWLSLSEFLWVFPEVYFLMFEFQFQISDVVMEDLNIVWTHLKFTWHICDHLEIYEFHLGNLNINYKGLKFICPNWILSKNIWISSQNIWKRPGKGVVSTGLDWNAVTAVINLRWSRSCFK